MTIPRPRVRRPLLAMAFVCAGLVCGHLSSGAAHAVLAGCNTDPVVVLSNGVTVQMTGAITTDVSNLTAVIWTLHIPAGTSVVSVTYDDNVSYKESLKYWADNLPNTYDGSVQVSTSLNKLVAGQVTVTGTTTAYATANPSGPSSSDTETGGLNQVIPMHVVY